MVVLVNYFFVIHFNDTHMNIVELRNGAVKQQLKYLMEKKNSIAKGHARRWSLVLLSFRFYNTFGLC